VKLGPLDHGNRVRAAPRPSTSHDGAPTPSSLRRGLPSRPSRSRAAPLECSTGPQSRQALRSAASRRLPPQLHTPHATASGRARGWSTNRGKDRSTDPRFHPFEQAPRQSALWPVLDVGRAIWVIVRLHALGCSGLAVAMIRFTASNQPLASDAECEYRVRRASLTPTASKCSHPVHGRAHAVARISETRRAGLIAVERPQEFRSAAR